MSKFKTHDTDGAAYNNLKLMKHHTYIFFLHIHSALAYKHLNFSIKYLAIVTKTLEIKQFL